VYLNGNKIFERGVVGNDNSNRVHYSTAVLLPSFIIKYDTINEIAFELYPAENETATFTEIIVTNRRSAELYVFWRNFWNLYMYQAMSLVSLIIAIYFIVFYFQRNNWHLKYYLWYALSNIMFVLGYTNNVFSTNYSDNLLLEQLTRFGLPLWGSFNACFLIEYSNIFKRKKVVMSLIVGIVLTSLIPMLFFNSVTSLLNYYRSYPATIAMINSIVYFVISLIFLYRKRSFISFLLFFTYLLAIASSVRETYYFVVLVQKPYLITLPYVMFLFQIVLFLILAFEQSEIYRVAVNRADELKKLTNSLEIKISERTEILKKMVDKLNGEIAIRQQSEKQLAENNAVKDKFFSIVAHDLRNPFAAVKGSVDLLKRNSRKYSEHELTQIIDNLDSSTKTTQKFLDDLLEWSRSQMNKITVKTEAILLRNVVAMIIDLVKLQAQSKNIDIENNINEQITVLADRHLLNTVIRNLLTNAIKFSYLQSKVVVEGMVKNNTVELFVIDSGIGISEENIPKLFSLENKYTTKGTAKEGGNGLGLLICNEFVEKMGGSIRVESIAGKGSQFVVSLPRPK